MLELTDVLRGGRQCDEDGVEIIMSREACHDAADEIESLRQRVKELSNQLHMEVSLRPQWAQGHTSDSVAAQLSTTALHDLWKLLGVDNQTDAIAELTALAEVAAMRKGETE